MLQALRVMVVTLAVQNRKEPMEARQSNPKRWRGLALEISSKINL